MKLAAEDVRCHIKKRLHFYQYKRTLSKSCSQGVGEIDTWVDFINILRAAFFACRFHKHKNTDSLTIFLRFWDLHAKKAACKMLVKSFLGLLRSVSKSYRHSPHII